MITDEQNEIIVRAMGWERYEYPVNMSYPYRWVHILHGEHDDCPRFDEPGELHEEMVNKYQLRSIPTRAGAWLSIPDSAYQEANEDGLLSKPWETSESRPIAECLAVLAYLAWVDEREK